MIWISSAGSTAADLRERVALGERAPECAILAQRDECLDQSPGSNHVPRRATAMSKAASGPCVLKKTSPVCARPRMRARNGMLSPLSDVRLACAVPVLVERANGLSRFVREAEHPRDVGAALAACDHDFARAFGSARQHAEQLPDASQPEVSGRDVSGDEAKRLERVRPVGHLEVGLDAVIVGAEERGKPGGVARAPEVLHQERVEERRAQSPDRQTEHLGDAHPDQAGAYGVSRLVCPSVRSRA